MSLPEVLKRPLNLPVIAAPMFIASGPELVIAQCQAGVIGSFPALNARPASDLAEWLDRIAEENAAYGLGNPEAIIAPFAVNQIVHRTNDRLDQDMAVLIDHKVPIVITSLGARPEINDAVHSYGGVVLHDIVSDAFARKAIDKGADGLIAVASGAGGHAGTQSPFALIQEIRAWFSGPLALSGAIAHGRSILAAQAAGADFAYIGSAFLSTHEANTIPQHRQMILDSSAKDIVYTNLFGGIHGNYLRGSLEKAGLDPDNLPAAEASLMNFGSTGDTEVKVWKDIWGSGQGIGAIDESRSVSELVGQFKGQYEDARLALASVTTPA